jgi:hypothetical protein
VWPPVVIDAAEDSLIQGERERPARRAASTAPRRAPVTASVTRQ